MKMASNAVFRTTYSQLTPGDSDPGCWRPGKPGAGRRAGMATRTKKKAETLVVPNPAKPGKVRLDAPPAKRHTSKKAYRRKPKHPLKGEE